MPSCVQNVTEAGSSCNPASPIAALIFCSVDLVHDLPRRRCRYTRKKLVIFVRLVMISVPLSLVTMILGMVISEFSYLLVYDVLRRGTETIFSVE